MKIAILGYGKMGKTIEQLAMKKGHDIVLKTNEYPDKDDLLEADVAIEFSTPESAFWNIALCIGNGIPVVSGTTGWLTKFDEMIKLCENSNGSFIYASNFSIGVNLFFIINDYVSDLMKDYKDYNVSIEEIHHLEKKDAPSGTAITLAEGIIQSSDKKGWKLDGQSDDDVIITSKRIEDVKGTHIVKYGSKTDSISIEHKAHNREGFALGALIAAEWLLDKKGVYTMKDVLKIN